MPRLFIATLIVCALATARGQVIEPVVLTGTVRTVSAGPRLQRDPHISGSRVSYTNQVPGSSSRIHVFDLATGVDTVLGPDPAFLDAVSDISGNIVVFTRREPVAGTQAIAFVNLSDPALTVTVLAMDPGVRRNSAAVGGDTIAFQQSTTSSNEVSAVCVSSVSNPSHPVQCLTSEEQSNANPAVSPDGNAVVFQKCVVPNTACDIYAAQRRADGTWSEPVAITSGGGNDLSPDTNGSIVVYTSDATGDFDVYYETISATGTATRLELTDAPGSIEWSPHISGALISFGRDLPGTTFTDLYVFDIATGALSRLPATPDIDEHLNDISIEPDGTVHIVYAAWDLLAPLDGENVYAFTFTLDGPSYQVCPLFDTTRSFKAGRVAPLRMQLCDTNGTNLSSAGLTLTATGLVQRDTTAAQVLAPESPGEANADGIFRYDVALGGYVFNLSTHGLAAGTWELQFRVSGDAAVHAITFDVR